MRLKIDKNSRGTLLIVYSLCAAAIAAILIFVRTEWIAWPLIALLLWFCVWQTAFFRVPERIRNGSGSKVSSVADGKIVIIGREVENEYLHRECLHVCIYMNFFDVHANFWPVDGRITYYKYHPGAHALAFKPKASEENEHTCTCILTPGGKEVFFKQIAGGFARRIVNYAKPGMNVRAGEQCGIIKFGSRIDYFLPLDCKLDIELGQVMRACESIITELQ